jgi:hypothetical protein
MDQLMRRHDPKKSLKHRTLAVPCLFYAREGVGHLWLLDPARQALEVYTLEGRRWSPQGTWSGQVSVRAEPFAALELSLGLLWAR